MSWTDSIGKAVKWIGDLTGVSDVVAEISDANTSSSPSGERVGAMEYAQIGAQNLAMPFKFIGNTFQLGLGVGQAYYEDFLEPLHDGVVGMQLALQAPLYAKPGQSWQDYASQAWAARDNVSMGQSQASAGIGLANKINSPLDAVTDPLLRGLPLGPIGVAASIWDSSDGDGEKWQSFNPLDKEDTQKAFSESQVRYATGTYDFAKDLILDPLNWAGAPVRAGMATMSGAKITAAEAAQASRWRPWSGTVSREKVLEQLSAGRYHLAGDFIAETSDKTALADWAYRSGMGINDPGAFAYVASPLNTREDALDLLAVLGANGTDGAAEAAQRLTTKYGDAYGYSLMRSQGDDPAARVAAATGDDIIDGDEAIDRIAADVMTQAEASEEGVAALERAQRELFQRGLNTLTKGGVPAAKRVAPVGMAMRGSARRALDMASRVSSQPVVSIYKPHRWHPLVAFMERPAGFVRVEEADSYREIVAQIRQIDKVTGDFVSSGQADEILSRWWEASSLPDPAQARGSIAGGLNAILVNKLVRKHLPDATDKVIDDLVNAAAERSGRAMTKLREKGWLSIALDDGSMGLLRAPVLQRATANSVQLYDARALAREFDRYGAEGLKPLLTNMASGAVDVMDVVNNIFKVSVLMRLGYTMRNLTEAAWSMAAVGELGHVLAAVGPERFSSWAKASKLASGRLVDRVGIRLGAFDSPEALMDQLASLDTTERITEVQLRRLVETVAGVDTRRLMKSGNEDDRMLAVQIEQARALLTQREVTYHGSADPKFRTDPSRPLSTSPSATMANRHAYQQSVKDVFGLNPDLLTQDVNRIWLDAKEAMDKARAAEREVWKRRKVPADADEVAAFTDEAGAAVAKADDATRRAYEVDEIRLSGDDARIAALVEEVGPDRALVLEMGRRLTVMLKGLAEEGYTIRRLVRDGSLPPGVRGLRGRFGDVRLEPRDARALKPESKRQGSWREVTDGRLQQRRTITADQLELWLDDPKALARAFDTEKVPEGDDAAIAAFLRQFEVIEPGKSPKAHPVESYGDTLDLTRHKTPIPLRASVVKRAQGGDQKAIKLLSDYAWRRGYARIVLPDRKAFGGQQVVVHPASIGPRGAEAVVERALARMTDEAPDLVRTTQRGGSPAPVGSLITPKQRRAERKASLRYRQGAGKIPDPINPDWNRDLAQTMTNGGLAQVALQLANRKLAINLSMDELTARQRVALARRAKHAPLTEQGGRFGTQHFTIPSRFGGLYDVSGPFESHAGGAFATAVANDTSYATILGSHQGLLAGGAMVPTAMPVGHPRYFEGWANILNKHFRDPDSRQVDPLVQRLLDGESVDDLIEWATKTKEGYEWAHAIGVTKLGGPDADPAARFARGGKSAKVDPETVEEAVVALAKATELYLPEAVRSLFRSGADTTPELLFELSKGQPLHPLHGLLIPTSAEARQNRNHLERLNAGMGRAMRVLGSIPETSFARHPLFVAEYRDEMARLVALAEESGVTALKPEQWNKLDMLAKRSAKAHVERTLFTVNRRSGFAQSTRLLFPFASAWENVFRRWGGFVKADPSLPLRAANLIARLSGPATIVDENGNEVTDAGKLTPNSMIVLPGLDKLNLPGRWGEAADALAQQTQIPLASLDLLFQGRPGDPGLGPWALLPVAHVMRAQPSAEKLLGWTMPYGMPESDLALFMPTALRRIKSMKDQDTQWLNTVSKTYLYEMYRYEQGERPKPPQMDEILEKAQSYYLIRVAANLLSPTTLVMTNERDWYAAKLRTLRDQHGWEEGEARFFTEYPDAGLLVQSLSRNRGGFIGSAKTVEAQKRYRQEMVDAYAQDDPELGGFIANYGQTHTKIDWSEAAYQWQRTNAPVPGSKETYREAANPMEAARQAKVQEGWRAWRMANEEVSSRLTVLGYSPQSKEYLDAVRMARTRAASDIAESGNTAWYQEYINPDTAKYERRADYFQRVLADSQFMRDHGNDPLMQSIGLYFNYRDKAREMIAERAARGGAKTFDAKANEDIAVQFNAIVERLRSDSPEFDTWVSRYFENDPVTAR